MFNIDLQPVFSVTVTANPPGPAEAQSFLATFEALGIAEFSSFDLGTPAGAKAFLDRAWLAVDDVVNDAGEPMPDSPALRARMIDLAWVRTPLVSAYLNGLAESQAGN
tara:strand:+ start:91 stop:414 length:324 start_codon:yes stop_codon:yes gene_type:complete